MDRIGEQFQLFASTQQLRLYYFGGLNPVLGNAFKNRMNMVFKIRPIVRK